MLLSDPQFGIRTFWVCQRTGQNGSTHRPSGLSRNVYVGSNPSGYVLQKRNRERDAAARSALKSSGWKVAVFWECQLKDQTELGGRLRHFLAKGGSKN